MVEGPKINDKRSIILLIIIIFILLASAIMIGFYDPDNGADIKLAPDFTATDHMNRTFSLSDNIGKVTVLHINQLESPLCLECEEQMRGQIEELELLAADNDTDVSIITLNIRKNEYSDDGWQLMYDWYGTNITWNWVEEHEPYTIASQYQKYWEVDSSFANPSLILIDHESNVVGVYHVYCLGTGELDGIQTHGSLAQDVEDILAGDWGDEFRGDISTGVSLGSMLLLGIATSFSPCSILLLLTMISYIGAQKDEEDADEGGDVDENNNEDKGANNETTGLDWKKGLWMGISFTLGTTLVFLIFGFLISYIGLFIEMSSTFYLVAGSILVILGINAIKPLTGLLDILKTNNTGREEASEIETETNDTGIKFGAGFIERLSKRSANLASFFLGIIFSIGWAPCAISLVFPVMVLMLAQDISILTGGMMMGAFGLGHGLVIIPFTVASSELKGKLGNKYMNAGRWIQPLFGLAIIAIGMIFAIRYFGIEMW